MALIVADSDILIDYLRGHGDKEEIVSLIKSGQLVTNAITYFELVSGAKTKKQTDKTEELLSLFEVLALDKTSANFAGNIYKNLLESGESLPMADCLIAGICISNKAMLYTRNLKHFQRIQDLLLFAGR